MSNDVHLAKVSKIQRTTDISKGGVVNIRRNMGRVSKGIHEAQPDIKHPDEVDYLFGSISPRGGTIQQQLGEIDSPDHTQRDTNESDNNISSCSTLDIVNKVENLSIHQLETQVRELSQRLQQADEQRTKMQRQLAECVAEKDLCFRRLEVVSAAHECRITEMHCVIAELSKKLRAKQETSIPEELEPEGSEISFQEGSVYNSELNLTNPDAECQTDPLDGGTYSVGEGFLNRDDNICAEIMDDFKLNDAVNKCQVETLQEEVFHLKGQIALLQSEIANLLRLDRNKVDEEQQSTEKFNDDMEANESNCSLEQLHFEQKKFEEQKNFEDEEKVDYFDTPQSEFLTLLKQCDPLTNLQTTPPILKMAERVKLRCGGKTDIGNILAPDLMNSLNPGNAVDFHSEGKQNKSMVESSADLDLATEHQRLQRKVEQLKVRNTLLSLTLDECKEHCEHLYLLCGKYESNAIALQSAVNCSDRAIEAYDVMLALLESKLALMQDKSVATEESRKAVESVARHLLDRLESEKNLCEHSLGPWQNTFNIPDKPCATWTPEDDNRLRYHVSKLKGRRSTVQNTIVNLESPFSDYHEKSRLALECGKDFLDKEKKSQMDLEMATFMQELLNLREENIELKSKADEANREQQYAMSRIGILQEALNQLTTDSNMLFHPEHMLENRGLWSEVEHAAVTEQQLVEALSRESELKNRIQALIASVSASQKVSYEKYEQLHKNIRELQNSNTSLNQLLEQNKRKYQARIRKLEQKIMELTMGLRQVTNESELPAQQPQRPKCINPLTKPLHCENVPETTL